jgi:hypothetical protein
VVACAGPVAAAVSGGAIVMHPGYRNQTSYLLDF